ncbi:MAG: LexA family transcriptional regulator [Alphaproteobacteria bacterium]|nr:LexA family transcriptional regulator [Alphaproteobacteria bacterium]
MKNRLKELRNAAGLSTYDLGAKVGATNSQISKLENGKTQLSMQWAERLAPHLGVDPLELFTRKGLQLPDMHSHEVVQKNGKNAAERARYARRLSYIDELDIRAGAAAGGRIAVDLGYGKAGELVEQYPVQNRWQIPSDIASHVTKTHPEHIKILQVEGSSMAPDFYPGERIMVDTRSIVPSPPGIFVVWDGFNLVIKHCQVVPHSDPPRVVLKSRDPDVDPYERVLGEAYIQGRVIGKWLWT